jgi:hypothetical protein
MRAPFVLLAALAPMLLVPPARLGAQVGVPSNEPLNAAVAARSGIFAPAILMPERRWTLAVRGEYGSAIERNVRSATGYLLDAELLRVQLTAVRGVGHHAFVLAQAGVTGAWAGFADGFFDGYHQVIGFVMPERDARPRDEYAYRLHLPEQNIMWSQPERTLALGDVRLGAGWRPSESAQTMVSVTLPTASRAAPFGRGTVTASVAQSLRGRLGARAAVEGAAAVGFAPRTGPLRPIQRQWTALGSLGVEVQVTRRLAGYTTLLVHGAAYDHTGLSELDGSAWIADVGMLLGTPGRRRWHVAIAEDLRRNDAGLDLVLKVGTGF